MKRAVVSIALTLSAGAAVLGWQSGRPLSETQIIDHYAAIYVERLGDGAQLTDCHAIAGTGAAHLTVICDHPSGGRAYFAVDQRGRLIGPDLPPKPEPQA